MTKSQEIESLFAKLIVGSQALMSANELQEVQHFIAHREYGLAFETYCDICVETRHVPPTECLMLLRQLAQNMQFGEERVKSFEDQTPS